MLNVDRYAWQQEARREFRFSPKQSFLVTATPGSGKTRFSLACINDVREIGAAQRVMVVVPTDHLRRQWAEAAHQYAGLNLNETFANGHGGIAPDCDGVVVTYHSVGRSPEVYRKLSAEKRTIVILDEIHHAGDSLTWGSGVREAFEPAVRRLLLSGTPFRSDNNKIPFVTYEPTEDGQWRSVADYCYGYGRAVSERAVRPIAFPALDGEMRWREAGEIKVGRLIAQKESERKAALRAALDPSGAWIGSVLEAANVELSWARGCVPDAGGLIIADSQQHA
ncbi:MAG: DEAD/DEAH box helicase family protein, partial [bacterium]